MNFGSLKWDFWVEPMIDCWDVLILKMVYHGLWFLVRASPKHIEAVIRKQRDKFAPVFFVMKPIVYKEHF